MKIVLAGIIARYPYGGVTWCSLMYLLGLRALGHEDPALTGAVGDVDAHYAKLKAVVEATVASRTTEDWQAHLAKAGVPASRVALPLEILDDAQPAANGMFARQDHPALAELRFSALLHDVHAL